MIPPFPGFFSGVRGSGEGATLDPRFTVREDPWARRARGELEGVAAGRGPGLSQDVLFGALAQGRRYGGTAAQTTLEQLLGQGKGLYDADREAIARRTADADTERDQSLRALYRRLSADDAAAGAGRQEALIAGMPGFERQRSAIQGMNADRLLSEQQALDRYGDQAFKADWQRRMSEDFARAAA